MLVAWRGTNDTGIVRHSSSPAEMADICHPENNSLRSKRSLQVTDSTQTKHPPLSGSTLAQSEYTALRDETLKHIEVQYQVVGVTLLAAGAFLTIGTQNNLTPDAPLVYPILAVFLAAAWADNQIGIIHIGAYIRSVFERGSDHRLRWEEVNFHYYQKPGVALHMIAMRGLFVVSQLLAMFLALDRLWGDTRSLQVVDVVLAALDLAAVAITVWLLRNPRRHLEEWHKSMKAVGAVGDAHTVTTITLE
jgi:hypothetical protein